MICDHAVIGACGVSFIYDFYNVSASDIINHVPNAGCGIVCAGFIDTPNCRLVYEYACKHWKLLWQTEVRNNVNSGNDFFFAVFDTTVREGQKYGFAAAHEKAEEEEEDNYDDFRWR